VKCCCNKKWRKKRVRNEIKTSENKIAANNNNENNNNFLDNASHVCNAGFFRCVSSTNAVLWERERKEWKKKNTQNIK
jgi:hypothetical protein